MNENQRFFAVLDGVKPDKIPWFADMKYYYDYLAMTGGLLPEWEGQEGYYRFCRSLGCGIMSYETFPFKAITDPSVKYHRKVEGNTVCEKYDTPLGSISCTSAFSEQSYSYGYTKHYVEDIRDFRVMCYIFEHTHYSENFAEMRVIEEMVGGDGVVINLPPICVSALQKLLSRWSGVSNLVNFIFDEEDESAELITRIQQSERNAILLVSEYEGRYVEFCENLSSEVTGGSLFKKYCMPYYREINDLLHKSNKKTGIHIDGTLAPCLSLLAESGFDIAEAVTPYPGGDLQLEDIRRAAGDDLIIWGGLPGIIFSETFPEKDFNEYLQQFVSTLRSDPKWIAGVADQVPPDSILERVKKIRRAIDTASY
ncbi:MAG: uroporphyrinogen decarboxylase family protein [Saccharofermentanales bacterium]